MGLTWVLLLRESELQGWGRGRSGTATALWIPLNNNKDEVRKSLFILMILKQLKLALTH